MYDTGKVIVGILVFLGVTTFPFWYNRASGSASLYPPPKKVDPRYHCVKDAEWMRAHHMTLLNEWRDSVVREGDRDFVADDGTHYQKSLSNTCLSCHADWTGFAEDKMRIPPAEQPRSCLECHDYAGVSVYCYDCHIHPEKY
jgi:hypothetical protein